MSKLNTRSIPAAAACLEKLLVIGLRKINF
jgi:hypothetical protein